MRPKFSGDLVAGTALAYALLAYALYAFDELGGACQSERRRERCRRKTDDSCKSDREFAEHDLNSFFPNHTVISVFAVQIRQLRPNECEVVHSIAKIFLVRHRPCATNIVN